MFWDKIDEVVVWCCIFMVILFKILLMVSYFWVIDGVDEFLCFGFLFFNKFFVIIFYDFYFFVIS